MSRFLDVIVWNSVNRGWSDVVAQSHLNASDHVAPVEVPGTQRAVLITGTSGSAATTNLVALRNGVVFISAATSGSGQADLPIVRALMKRTLSRTS